MRAWEDREVDLRLAIETGGHPLSNINENGELHLADVFSGNLWRGPTRQAHESARLMKQISRRGLV